MKSNLIVMLTLNDQTISNAVEVFEECKDLPIEYWGFKNVGITEKEMEKLILAMKQANKKIFLEVVTYTEKSCMSAAKFACENGIDYLLGTKFYPSVWDYIKKNKINYFPFVGNVYGSPSVLSGSLEQILIDARKICDAGVSGLDLLAYRYIEGNPILLAKDLIDNLSEKIIIAGSIDSYSKLKDISSLNPWGFTIGGALYKSAFVANENVRNNLKKVLTIMDNIN